MIQISNVSKRYSIHQVLKQCNMTIEKGKIVGLIGENGCGKTTLLKVLAGILRPNHGRIDGIHENDRSRFISYSPDNSYFYPYFTIEALMDFYQDVYEDFDRDRAESLLHFFELEKKQKIRHLSKGQAGRVKILITIARRAPLLMLDEPLAGLDPMVKQKIIKSLIQFIDLEQQTLLMTTHELMEVEPLLDDVVVMKHGTIIEQSSVESIRENDMVSLQQWLENTY
ncbi:ABC transporter [Gracilibacillus halophilus YIM-C55.5]|uniref:ABC transporter n=1 Tax=Gracilibacillus halophilus YIM-C55.5 TaxID=1308866 RepID=N4WLV7_9BACI|nr:ABC transporter ATP-binding protein [Gracilibacillus halophilus]ENH97137.1 ABC transporter [Gracilibacillus halophilus YIM-C55.5]